MKCLLRLYCSRNNSHHKRKVLLVVSKYWHGSVLHQSSSNKTTLLALPFVFDGNNMWNGANCSWKTRDQIVHENKTTTPRKVIQGIQRSIKYRHQLEKQKAVSVHVDALQTLINAANELKQPRNWKNSLNNDHAFMKTRLAVM